MSADGKEYKLINDAALKAAAACPLSMADMMSDEQIARLIGDKSIRMGAHYTRHVEDEVSIAQAFSRLKDAR